VIAADYAQPARGLDFTGVVRTGSSMLEAVRER
jgi:hypothetical protein